MGDSWAGGLAEVRYHPAERSPHGESQDRNRHETPSVGRRVLWCAKGMIGSLTPLPLQPTLLMTEDVGHHGWTAHPPERRSRLRETGRRRFWLLDAPAHSLTTSSVAGVQGTHRAGLTRRAHAPRSAPPRVVPCRDAVSIATRRCPAPPQASRGRRAPASAPPGAHRPRWL